MSARQAVVLCGLLASATVAASETAEINRRSFVVGVEARTPVQISAFYEARGFPSDGLDRLSTHCFFTVRIHNGTQDVVWLEPSRWRIRSANAAETAGRAPLGQEYWRQQWRDVGLTDALQATFRWTQLPELRDLQPDEPVGGNIAIRRIEGPLLLEMVFDTGQDRAGSQISRKFANLSCGGNEPSIQDKKG